MHTERFSWDCHVEKWTVSAMITDAMCHFVRSNLIIISNRSRHAIACSHTLQKLWWYASMWNCDLWVREEWKEKNSLRCPPSRRKQKKSIEAAVFFWLFLPLNFILCFFSLTKSEWEREASATKSARLPPHFYAIYHFKWNVY